MLYAIPDLAHEDSTSDPERLITDALERALYARAGNKGWYKIWA